MRWKMCPKCNVKLSHDVNEQDLDIFKCNVCKQAYLEVKGDLLRYIEAKAKVVDMEADAFLKDILERLE